MLQIYESAISFFKDDFFQESTLVIMSVILGGIITVVINKGAMQKQSHFDMRRKIIEKLLEQCQELQKELEYLEISLSFDKLHGDDCNECIHNVSTLCLSLNESLRTKRKFVRKYVTAVAVEESSKLVSDFVRAMLYFGEGGITDIKSKGKIDSEMINSLRQMNEDAKNLSNALTESLEKLISPGILSRLGRIIRPIGMLCDEFYAIWKVDRKKRRRNKHRPPSF